MLFSTCVYTYLKIHHDQTWQKGGIAWLSMREYLTSTTIEDITFFRYKKTKLFHM